MTDVIREQGYKVTKQDVIDELKKLEQRDGVLMVSSVVEAARVENSALHGYFDWDDDRAAELWRREQARNLINHVKVTLLGKERDGFHSVIVSIKGENVRGYVSAEKVATNEELRVQVIEAALKEIKNWQSKYRDLQELSGVVNKDRIEEVEGSLQVNP